VPGFVPSRSSERAHTVSRRRQAKSLSPVHRYPPLPWICPEGYLGRTTSRFLRFSVSRHLNSLVPRPPGQALKASASLCDAGNLRYLEVRYERTQEQTPVEKLGRTDPAQSRHHRDSSRTWTRVSPKVRSIPFALLHTNAVRTLKVVGTRNWPPIPLRSSRRNPRPWSSSTVQPFGIMSESTDGPRTR